MKNFTIKCTLLGTWKEIILIIDNYSSNRADLITSKDKINQHLLSSSYTWLELL